MFLVAVLGGEGRVVASLETDPLQAEFAKLLTLSSQQFSKPGDPHAYFSAETGNSKALCVPHCASHRPRGAARCALG